ncbi:CAP domain-containing protein [Strongyloides ratti]|uniref:CAP domain-containing protein n=1 Tax=Strongyloides ratti TaxID=34506 RepID=A0A090LGC5_STRRB|nr:CAP domain-containing protein [Strongyloides ratti]CEF66575.1 CAP domain-containing protein [Strongyloides ratti]
MVYLFLIICILSIIDILQSFNVDANNDDVLRRLPQLNKEFRARPRNLNGFQDKARDTKIKFNGRHIKEFDKNEPPINVADNKKKKFGIQSKHSSQNDKSAFNIEKYLGRNRVSNKIWQHVWKHCKEPRCYAANNFAPMLGKLLEETNYYRKLHNAKPLTISHRLNMMAYLQAKKNAFGGKIPHYMDRMYGKISGIIETIYCPLMAKRWYDEGLKYKYGVNMVTPAAYHFTTLVWKATSQIGIAIIKRNPYVYYTFMFWPRGNEKNYFRYNVSRPIYNSLFMSKLFKSGY